MKVRLIKAGFNYYDMHYIILFLFYSVIAWSSERSKIMYYWLNFTLKMRTFFRIRMYGKKSVDWFWSYKLENVIENTGVYRRFYE